MSLQRDLLRGTGFWPTIKLIARQTGGKVTADMLQKFLPKYDFLDLNNHEIVDSLLLEALPVDRARLA